MVSITLQLAENIYQFWIKKKDKTMKVNKVGHTQQARIKEKV